jgi:hypothetical protein
MGRGLMSCPEPGFGYLVGWSLPGQLGIVRVLSRRGMSAMAEDGELGGLDGPAGGENDGPNPVHPPAPEMDGFSGSRLAGSEAVR